MRLSQLRRTLNDLDAREIWAFYVQTLRLVMSKDAEPAFAKTLRSAVAAGELTRICPGLYVNPSARSMPADPLTHLVDMMRPCCTNYLSLESVLSEAGVISQLPGRYTVMSTGKSATIHTPFGVVEFVRTRRASAAEQAGITFDEGRGMLVASPDVALRDLRRCGRSLDLIRTAEEVH